MTPAAGRPLRFLMLVLGGWTAMRIAVLMPEAAELAGLVTADAAPAAIRIASLPPRLRDRWPSGSVAAPPLLARRSSAEAATGTGAAPADRVTLALLSRIGFGEPQRRPRPALAAPYAPATQVFTNRLSPPPRPFVAASRLSGSGWLALRDGGGESLGPGGQLGGSQGGVRLRYALGAARTLALSARLSAPTRGLGREAALGLEWRPQGSPVALIAEQRLGLDGTPGGPALMAVGGIAPRPIAAGFTLEGYAQGGAVLRGGRSEPFADGAMRLARPVARLGAGELTLGAGAWGGAQRDAQRLDLGPSLALSLPLADHSLRLSLDWRQRVAGAARPGSGLAITLGSDF